MSNITLSATFANALLSHDATAAQSAVADQIGSGTLSIYSGTAPTGANESPTTNPPTSTTILATWTFAANTAFSAASSGSMTLDIPTTTVTAVATGTATFFRIWSSGTNSLIQGLVGTSGADFNLSSTSITSGDNVSITGTPTIAWTVT